MSTILKLTCSDKKEIVFFLKSNSDVNEEEIENFFKLQSFNSLKEKDYFVGWCIKDKEKQIRGFLGAITHYSPYHKNKLVVNMTNWVVCKKFRSQSLSLLRSFTNNKSCIYTNYSASENVQMILPHFGFKIIDNGTKIYNTYYNFKFKLNFGFKYGKSALNFFRGTKHEKIIRDHINIGGIFIANSAGRGYLFFKKKKTFSNDLFLIHVINFSPTCFKNDWKYICTFAFFRHLVTKIFIDSRFSPKEIKYNNFKKRKMFVKGLLKNEELPTRVFSEPLQKFIR